MGTPSIQNPWYNTARDPPGEHHYEDVTDGYDRTNTPRCRRHEFRPATLTSLYHRRVPVLPRRVTLQVTMGSKRCCIIFLLMMMLTLQLIGLASIATVLVLTRQELSALSQQLRDFTQTSNQIPCQPPSGSGDWQRYEFEEQYYID